MPSNKDMFAPPSEEELEMFAAPSEEELKSLVPARKGLAEKVGSNISSYIPSSIPSLNDVVNSIQGTSLGGTSMDAGLAGIHGMTAGALDEITAGLQTGGELMNEAIGSPFGDSEQPGTPLERYRRNQQLLDKEVEGAHDRSPVISGAAEFAGGLATGSAVGKIMGAGAVGGSAKLADIYRNKDKMEALKQLGTKGGNFVLQNLPVSMAQSALSSKEGGLTTPEERDQLAEDVVGGGLYGLAAGGALQTGASLLPMAGRAIAKSVKEPTQKLIESTPLLRQMKVGFKDYGLKGQNPRAETERLKYEIPEGDSGKKVSKLDREHIEKLTDQVYEAQNEIGQAVGDTLKKATADGISVSLSPDIAKSLIPIKELAKTYPGLAPDNPRTRQLYDQITKAGQKYISPIQAKEILDDMDIYISELSNKSITLNPLEKGVLKNLNATRELFSNTLNAAVPEHGIQAARYYDFMKLVPETMIARNKPVDLDRKFFSQRRKGDTDLYDAMNELVTKTTKEGSATDVADKSFVPTMEGLLEFEKGEAARLASGQIKSSALKKPVSAFADEIKEYSDDAVVRGTSGVLDPHAGAGRGVLSSIFSLGGTGRSLAVGSAIKAGQLQHKLTSGPPSKNIVARLSRAVFNAPNETVNTLAERLKGTPGLEKYGNQLTEALQSPNTHRKNQVLFTIMQNPSSRMLVGDVVPEEQE